MEWLVDLVGSGLAYVGAGLTIWFTRTPARRSASLRKVLLRIVPAWIVAYGTITALLPGLTDNWLLLPAVLWSPLFVVPAATWSRRLREAGRVLRVVRGPSSVRILVVAVAVGAVTPSAVSLMYPALAGADRLFLTLLLEMLPLAGALHARIGLRISESGMLGYARFVPWDAVESFQWYEKPRLRLVVRTRPEDGDTPVTKLPYEEWVIPAREREVVASLMRDRIPDRELPARTRWLRREDAKDPPAAGVEGETEGIVGGETHRSVEP